MDWRNHPWYCTRCNVWMGVLMKHKHAELIKAWADGAEIQARLAEGYGTGGWYDTDIPTWGLDKEYRIKPEPKPDVVEEAYVMKRISGEVYVCQGFHEIPNARFVWDGETGKLKSAEVLK